MLLNIRNLKNKQTISKILSNSDICQCGSTVRQQANFFLLLQNFFVIFSFSVSIIHISLHFVETRFNNLNKYLLVRESKAKKVERITAAFMT